MELMSSLLLCALVALLPQALGEVHGVRSQAIDIKFNNSMLFNQSQTLNKIPLNINVPSLTNMDNELQVVFMDIHCEKCVSCMERAIKAYKTNNYIVKSRLKMDELPEDILDNFRTKREVSKTEFTTVKTNRSKSNKKRTSKSVTVTKYNVDGEVYALKVKETNSQVHEEKHNGTQLSTCQVYSVKKSIPCDTPEGDVFLTIAKRKLSKKNKREKERNKLAASTTTGKPHYIAPSFRKRQIDDSQMPENIMPSIEELY